MTTPGEVFFGEPAASSVYEFKEDGPDSRAITKEELKSTHECCQSWSASVRNEYRYRASAISRWTPGSGD
jgi:hypothetical protein